MAHGSRKFFASGSLLANLNLLLPLWVIVVVFSEQLFLVGLIVLTPRSQPSPLMDSRLTVAIAIAFAGLIPTAALLWFAHRHGLQPRLIDPFRFGRYYSGHGLIAFTSLTIIG
jgi:hypothetical protein